MKLPLPEELDLAQALRYLGCGQAGEAQLAALRPWVGALKQAAAPRGAVRLMRMDQLPPGLLQGRDIRRHLRGCGQCLLFAVTLGNGVDALLRRLMAVDMAGAAAADALASALAEQVCDAYEQRLRAHCMAQGLWLSGRYSPGYGDWPLEVQPLLCRLADTQRAIGLCPSPGGLLTPLKSVTAVLGVSDGPQGGAPKPGCAHCAQRDSCIYRKRGTSCEKG